MSDELYFNGTPDPAERQAFPSAIERPEHRPYWLRDDISGRMSRDFLECVEAARVRMSISQFCDSPIESHFGGILSVVLQDAAAATDKKFAICAQEDQPGFGPDYILLIPQYKWKRYRYDFAVRHAKYRLPSVFIECDGQAFHSSADQLANDRKKDEEARIKQIHMVRIKGADIYRDPIWCVRQVVKYL